MEIIKETKQKGKRRSWESIAADGLRTTSIDVKVDYNGFFSRYSIVSYCCGEKKCMSYERLSGTGHLSVTGIYENWDKESKGYNRYFVMTRVGEETPVIELLRSSRLHSLNIRAKIDRLDGYSEKTRIRIITSLLLNTLSRQSEKRYYNNGALYLSDDLNFTYRKNDKELVCLRIDVNPYLVLKASTVTFTECPNIEILKRRIDLPIFRINHPLIGDNWSGMTIMPFIPKGKIEDIELKGLYIKKSFSPYKHNTVPQFVTSEEELRSNKVYVLNQLVAKLNERYADFFHIDFATFPVKHFEECKSGPFERAFDELLRNYFTGMKINIINTLPEDSVAIHYVEELCKELTDYMGSTPLTVQVNDTAKDGMMIRVVGQRPNPKKKEEMEADTYAKGTEIKQYGTIQHTIAKKVKRNAGKPNKNGKIIHHTDPIEHEMKRILLELLVKDCNSQRLLPASLTDNLQNWNFLLFKVVEDYVYGGSLQVDPEGAMHYIEYGRDDDFETDNTIEAFSDEVLHLTRFKFFSSSKEYKVLIKDRNIYMLVDTDENPILDTDLLDELYERHQEADDNGRSAANEMRKSENIDKYLSGYIGFRIWETEGLGYNTYPSISYLVGETKGKSTVNRKFKSAPRTKRIYVLDAANPERIQDDVLEIIEMLKNVFGRFGEFEAYPYPFKFLKEFLNRTNLEQRSFGWDRLNWKSLNNLQEEEEDE